MVLIQDENDKKNRIYMNVDGEYIQIIRPKELRVRSHKHFPRGAIKFIGRKEGK